VPLSIGGLLGSFTSRTASETLGFGIGVALAEALRPEATVLGQDSWAALPSKAVDAELAAAIVAESVELLGWGQGEAAKGGISGERFAAILGEALNAPAVGELLRMRRRRTIDAGDFAHGLRKAKLEERWDEAVAELEQERLDPAAIAVMVQRGILRLAGLLPVGPPEGVGRVPPMPMVDLDPIAEAAASGVDRDRLAAMTRIVGLPPGPGELAQLLNRREIDETDYLRGIAEGNTRNEWGRFLMALRRRLLTPHEYVEGRLRGWIDDAEMRDGAALSGMEAADTDLLAKLSGRPLSWHQVFIGLRRGGDYEGATGPIAPPFLKALQESNIRPEWYSLAWAQRFTYPSAFVLRALTTAGELSAAETETILLYLGWEPELAGKVSARWAGSVAGAGKEETKTELEDEYAGGFMAEAEFRAALEQLGYTGHVQDLLVHLGDARRIKRHREKVVDAIGKAMVAGSIEETAALSELAEINVTGEAATLLTSLWAKQRRFAAA
jgi:hypothetical protein